MKPIIGVIANTEKDNTIINHLYLQAIEEVDGIPVIISPSIKKEYIDLINQMDGILLTGGGDIDPKYFNEMTLRYCGNIDPQRDRMEIEVAKHALGNNIPILGICRGIQVLAVACGATIYQDIYAQRQSSIKLQHEQRAPEWHGIHEISIEPMSKLHEIYKQSKLKVNSFHHQSIKDMPNELIVSAKSKDGVIEAIEHSTAEYYLGVQWHPERMFKHTSIQRNIFQSLISAAEK